MILIDIRDHDFIDTVLENWRLESTSRLYLYKTARSGNGPKFITLASIRTRETVITSSLRELFAIVLFFALGLAALRTGGVLAATTLFVSGLLLMAMAIVAFVAIGVPKAYAIGFLLPVTLYLVCVALAGRNELDPYDGKLPTTSLIRYAHQWLVTTNYVDSVTGKVIPNYDPAADRRSGTVPGSMGMGGMGMSGMAMGGMMSGPMIVEIPSDRLTFMLLAHTLFTLIFGWLGAKFACRVYYLQHPELRSNERSKT